MAVGVKPCIPEVAAMSLWRLKPMQEIGSQGRPRLCLHDWFNLVYSYLGKAWFSKNGDIWQQQAGPEEATLLDCLCPHVSIKVFSPNTWRAFT